MPPDFNQAKAYLEQAAYHGIARAAMQLSRMYHLGLGMPASPIEAYAWSEVASLEGNVFARRERDASLHDLKESDQQQAVARADEFSAGSHARPPRRARQAQHRNEELARAHRRTGGAVSSFDRRSGVELNRCVCAARRGSAGSSTLAKFISFPMA